MASGLCSYFVRNWYAPCLYSTAECQLIEQENPFPGDICVSYLYLSKWDSVN